MQVTDEVAVSMVLNSVVKKLQPSRKENYYEADAVSQSQLSALDKSPSYYLYLMNKEDEEYNEAFMIGNIVDDYITNTESFSKYIPLDNIPTGQMKVYTEALVRIRNNPFILDGVSTVFDNKNDDHVNATQQEAYKITKSKLSINNFRGPKFVESGAQAYYNTLMNKPEGILVSQDLYDRAVAMAEALLTDERCSKYIVPGSFENSDYLFQFPIYWQFNGILCKSLLDNLIVDHENKTIQPIDIKTTGDGVYDFSYSFIKWRYYIQASFYTYAVEYWKSSLDASEMYQGKNISDYLVLPFKFIVASKMFISEPPLVWTVDQETLQMGAHGTTLATGRKIKGFIELLEELKWHKETNSWEHKKEVYQQGGMTLSFSTIG